MDNSSLMKELEDWLDQEQKDYNNGGGCSIGESATGHAIIKNVQRKIASLKEKHKVESDQGEWIDVNLPYLHCVYDPHLYPDTFTKRKLNKPGTLIETDEGVFLIGHLNSRNEIGDDVNFFDSRTIVKRYKVIWTEEQ